MPELIEAPTRVAAAGTRPKVIEEFAGRVNTGEQRVSVARMRSPEGWVEPGQQPDFDEYTLVLDGTLRVEYRTHSPARAAPTTSRSASRPSRRRRCTAT